MKKEDQEEEKKEGKGRREWYFGGYWKRNQPERKENKQMVREIERQIDRQADRRTLYQFRQVQNMTTDRTAGRQTDRKK